jgi:thioester reductase-like protein
VSCATSFETVHLGTHAVLDDFFSVGKPIANTSIIIVDDRGEPVPLGFPGEIAVGGVGVAHGYLNSDQPTEEKFVALNGCLTSEERERGCTKVYKTADRGRLLQDGSLVFMGRLDGDSTIKLRGLRIDLDDVAATLIRAFKGLVVDACVAVQADLECLVAYVVLAKDAEARAADLDRIVKTLDLPKYMIPARTIALDRLPTSPNGKVDRRLLASQPLPSELLGQGAGAVQQEPLLLMEGQLKLLWEEVLGKGPGREPLTRSSDFFMAGGNSHLLVKLKAAIEESQGVSMSIRELYSASSLGSMAAMIGAELGSHTPAELCWEKEIEDLQRGLVPREEAAGSAPDKPRTHARHILLTGSASFLGLAILKALIQDDSVDMVHCIAVAPEAGERLPKSPKVAVYQGSLTRPNLGLTSSEWEALESRVDIIVHAGSNGHCLNNYHSLVVPNVHSTVRLANMAARRRIPLHFVSSNRVTLLSGNMALPPVSVAHQRPDATDGSEGFTCTKWISECLLETAASRAGLSGCVHRPCALVGDEAPSHDALNSLLRFSVLMKAVPRMENLEGFLDFKHVDEVARDITRDALQDHRGSDTNPTSGSVGAVIFRHHSSGIIVPVDKFRERMEEEYGQQFHHMEMGAWLERARALGLDELIVGYLQSLATKGQTMAFPYMGATLSG